ncbi:MAG: RNA polymerase factor sigma-54 [Candidatus Omnitrophota bacterium]
MKLAPQIRLENEINVRPEVAPRLRLTPQIKQAINILQMPLLELKNFLDRELTENPLLERENPECEGEMKSGEEIDRLVARADDEFEDAEQGCGSQFQKNKDFLESLLTKPVTLAEHLFRQLRILNLSESEQKIGEMIIGNLDDNGYLHTSLNEIAAMLGAEAGQAERMLSIIQEFDPPGVGARDLEECLFIQLKAKGEDSYLASLIIKNHFFDLKMKRYEKISRRLGISVSEIKQARDKIACLEPKPGRNFGHREATNIIPDMILRKADGDFIIESNANELRLRINPFYKRMLNGNNIPGPAKKYLKERLGSALWLIKAVNRRQETIRRIIECLIVLQREFLDKGPLHLNSLQLKDVADILRLHKSTVSRAIAGKYIQTPAGIFELKYFFDGGIKDDNSRPRSSKNIKARIENLINTEDPKKPLSDERIARILRSQGIRLARRTVAKYREQLKFLPTYLRKQ